MPPHPPQTLISVAMPVRGVGRHLERALRSILDQTHRDLDVIVVVNPGDGETADAVPRLARGDARVRVLERPSPGLASALNLVIREARSDLIARMDGDDWCHPERIAKQQAAMEGDPTRAAVGCAYAVVDEETGEEIERLTPPTRPEEVAWRLMLGNVLAHGSMMVRRDAVRDAGGYDETLERGQDYELWVRMTAMGMRIGNLGEVLYWYRMARERRGAGAGDAIQARSAAGTMAGAWTGLRATGKRAEIEDACAGVIRAAVTPGAGMMAIAGIMEAEGPTREGLLAWLWCKERASAAQWRAIEAGRRARVREVGRSVRDAGVSRVWLWGAGLHTQWMVEHRGELGVAIAGVVDDARVGERIGSFTVTASDGLRAGDAGLISSDTAEDALWRASGEARARGVRVWRIYGGE